MHRSTATRSFDLLLRDFASINLRQHRARNFFLHHHSRRLFSAGATEPLKWHNVEAHELGDKRWRDEGVGLNVTGYEKPREEATGDTLPLEEGDGKWRDDDDWHAEIAVGQVAAATAAGALPQGVGADLDVTPGDSGAEQIPFQDLPTTSAQTSGGAPGSRAASRLARRQRRELAGNFKPQDAARKQQDANEVEAEGESHDSVLKMIEKMEGPAIAKRKPKSSKRENGEDAGKGQQSGEELPSARLRKLAQGKQGKDKKDALAASKPKRDRERWQIEKEAMLNKFGNATWQPRKRLSPDTMEGIRALHASDPATYSTATLSSQFEVSPENIRRILKSKWQPSDEEREDRSKRWERRGVRKWTEMAEMGEKPPRRWRELGVGSVKGEPEKKPLWKRGGGGGRRKDEVQEADEAWVDEEEFGERIL